MRELAAEAISVVPVRPVKEVLKAVETRASGLIQDIPAPTVGQIPIPTGLFSSRAFGLTPQSRQPLLGEHSGHILSRLLGYDNTTIDDLIADGVIQQTPVPAETDGRDAD